MHNHRETVIDLRKILLNNFRVLFPEKNIYLGEYGKIIDFRIFFDPYGKNEYWRKKECKKCGNSSDCKDIRDGKFLFILYRNCPLDDYRDLEEEIYRKNYDFNNNN